MALLWHSAVEGPFPSDGIIIGFSCGSGAKRSTFRTYLPNLCPLKHSAWDAAAWHWSHGKRCCIERSSNITPTVDWFWKSATTSQGSLLVGQICWSIILVPLQQKNIRYFLEMLFKTLLKNSN
jgi:hypothetical protein